MWYYLCRLALRYFVGSVTFVIFDGLLTGKAVVHKWFRDIRHARENSIPPIAVIWRLQHNAKSHGQLGSFLPHSFHDSNNWTAEDMAKTSWKVIETRKCSFSSIYISIDAQPVENSTPVPVLNVCYELDQVRDIETFSLWFRLTPRYFHGVKMII